MSYLTKHTYPLYLCDEPYERIYVPTLFPTQNVVMGWHPLQRSKSVSAIHKMVELCAESYMGEVKLPDDYTFDWAESGLVNNQELRWDWFQKWWLKSVLGLGKSRKVKGKRVKSQPRPLKEGTHTIIELHHVGNKTAIHVHSVRARLTDEDGVSCKAIVDALVCAGFFPDDRAKYVYSVTQSQEKI